MPRSCEEKILQTYFSKLVNAIVNPEHLAGAFYSAGLIDKSTRLNASLPNKNTLEKASTLLSAIERVISVSPDKFQDFLAILKENLTTESLLEEIEEEYNNNNKMKTTPTATTMNESSTVRQRPTTANEKSFPTETNTSTSSNRTDDFSYWPAIKGIGTVALISLLIWILCMYFYTTPQTMVNLKKVQEKMAEERTRDASVQCHKLTNPNLAFEELKNEISNALTLGTHLGLPKVKVDIIERENRSEAEKLIGVLQTCYDYDLCGCWEHIVKAVEKYGNSRKAKEIEQKFIIKSKE